MIKLIVYSFLKTYSIRMKTVKRLNITDWSGYSFIEMVKINDIDLEKLLINDFKDCKDGSVLFSIAYCEENSVPYVAWNIIGCIFKKIGIYSVK